MLHCHSLLRLARGLAIALAVVGASLASAAYGVDGTWNIGSTTPVSWGTATNWASSAIADGVGAKATMTLNVNSNVLQKINLDDGASALGVTIGRIDLSDSGSQDGGRAIETGLGGSLTFNGTGMTDNLALLNMSGSAKGTYISAPIYLATDLKYTEGYSGQPLTTRSYISGTIQASTEGLKTLTVFGTYNRPTALIGDIFNGAGQIALVFNTVTTSNPVSVSGANTYTGGTTLTAGAVKFAKAASLPGYDGAIGAEKTITVSSTATLVVAAGGAAGWTSGEIDALRAAVTFPSGSTLGIDTANATFSYASNIGGDQGLAKYGANTLTLSGTNTYAGTTTVWGGALAPSAAASLPGYNSAGKVVANSGGTLYIKTGTAGWTNTQLADLVANATFNTGSVLAVDTADGDAAISTPTVIGGPGGLTKHGANTLTLSGANSYAGPTTITGGGILSVDTLADGGVDSSIGKSPLASANLVFQSGGGTLRYTGGTTSTNRNYTVTTSNAAFDASGTGPLTMSGGNNAPGDTHVLLTLTGTNQDANTYAGNLGDKGGGWKTGLAKTGTGKWVLTGTRTYTNLTTVSGGILAADTLANAGSVSSIGTGALTIQTGGTFQYIGPAVTINRGFTVGNGGGIFDASGTGALVITGNVGQGGTANSARTLTLTGTNTGDNTLQGTIGNMGTGKTSLAKTGGGKWILTGDNSYTGATQISGGVLSVATLANGGSNSNIGKSTNDAANLVFNGGTLRYTGAAATTNRNFTLGESGGTIDASGTGAVTFDNTTVAFSGSADTARTLTLAGGNTDDNILVAAIGNNGTGATSLVKDGLGTWVLKGQNTYTGDTTINAGALTLDSAGWLTLDVNAAGGFSEILGSGTVNLNGILKFDVADAGASGSWQVVAAGLTKNYALADVQLVGGPSFTNTSGVWTSGDWTFTQATGLLTLGSAGPTGQSTWTHTAGGTWDPGHWDHGVPNAVGHTATFADSIVAGTTATITLDGDRTVSQVTFNAADSRSYTIAAGSPAGALTLEAAAGNASIAATAGSNTIDAQVKTAGSNLDVSVAGGATLDLTAGISNAATKVVNLTGAVPGALDIGPIANAGTVNVAAGTVDVAAIDGAGNTTVTAAATLITAHVRQDTLTINAGSTVTINTAGGASGTSVVDFLQISNGTDFNWGGGAVADAASVGGGANDAGSVVNAVPEPTTWLLVAMAALAGLFLRRRR